MVRSRSLAASLALGNLGVKRISLNAGLLAAALAVAATACSGAKGGGTPSAGGVAPITDQDLRTHVRIMSATDVALDALLATTPQPSAAALASALAAIPGVLATGTAAGPGPTAWAELPPGRIYLLITVEAPAPPALAPSHPAPRPAPKSIPPTTSLAPAVAQAAPNAPGYLLLWDGFSLDPTPKIQAILDAKGYRGLRAMVSLPMLRSVGAGRPNVLFLAAHGGVNAAINCWETNQVNPPSCYVLSVPDEVPLSTPVTEWPAALRDDANGRRLAYHKNFLDRVWTLAINSSFAARYFRFAENSLFMLEACHGAEPGAGEWMNTLLMNDTGLAAYAGWEGAVEEPQGGEVAALFFDRMVGGNSVAPIPDPPQRPFDAVSVIQELARIGKDKTYTPPSEGGGVATLRVIPRVPFTPAPSIEQTIPDARTRRVKATGSFGKDPGTDRRIVKVGGTAVQVVCWAEALIEADLPPAGGGDLVVTSDGVDSNPVQLTEWHGTITHDAQTWFAYNPAFTGQGSATFDVRFRADVHDYRAQAGEAPIQQVQSIFEIDEGSSLKGSGSSTFNGTTTPFSSDTTRLGRLDYSASKGWLNYQTWPFPLATNFLDGLGWIDVTAHKLYLFLYGQVGGGSRTYGMDFGTAWASSGGTCPFKFVPANGATYLTLDLDPSFTIAAGSCQWDIPCIFGADCKVSVVGSHKLTWRFVTAAPPDMQAPR
jgi:hypothetical protein